jgi:hypothetical protein
MVRALEFYLKLIFIFFDATFSYTIKQDLKVMWHDRLLLHLLSFIGVKSIQKIEANLTIFF